MAKHSIKKISLTNFTENGEEEIDNYSDTMRRRFISLGEGEVHRRDQFPRNRVRTAPYRSAADLLLRGVYDLVADSVSSLYFLMVSLFQMLTPWGPTGRWSTAVPFALNKLLQFVVVWNVTRSLWAHDRAINQRVTPICSLSERGMTYRRREDLRVGDFVALEVDPSQQAATAAAVAAAAAADSSLSSTAPDADSAAASAILVVRDRVDVPVDLLLIQCEGGELFVDMSSLTGEKDLVSRRPPLGLSLSPAEIASFHSHPYCGVLESVASRADNAWSGTLHVGAHAYPCASENLLVAGSYLTRGKRVYGIVVHTGSDTLSYRSRNALDRKRWPMVRALDVVESVMLVILALLIALGALGHFQNLPYRSISDLTVLFSYWLLFNGLIAQSLHFTLTFVRSLQRAASRHEPVLETLGVSSALRRLGLYGLASALGLDRYLRCEVAEDQKPDIRDECALESIGLAEVIIFDKTGTLTTNQLQPVEFALHSAAARTADVGAAVGGSRPPGAVREVRLHDLEAGADVTYLRDEISDDMHAAFTAALLCNSVNRENPEEAGAIAYPGYFGSSGDELALLNGIFRSARYVMESKVAVLDGLQVRFSTPLHRDGDWCVLHEYKYSSARALMAVIARNRATGNVHLFAKGSPTRVAPMLIQSQQEEALELVHELASRGRRVLLFAARELPWCDLEPELRAIDAVAEGRAEARDRLIERELSGLNCVGVSGIHDVLQPDLKHHIRSLKRAGIKTVVCTGDIMQTALIVATNCGILPEAVYLGGPTYSSPAPSLPSSLRSSDETPEARRNVFHIHENGDHSLMEMLSAAMGERELDFGLLLDNHAVSEIALGGEDALRDVFQQVVAMPNFVGAVAYRALPQTKKALTLLMKGMGMLTVCVGDGANDIDMILEADVGVGIRGESQMASAVSDIALSSVRFLPALILHDGKQAWERNTLIALLITSMKLSVVLSLFLYDAWELDYATTPPLFAGGMLLAFNLFYGWGAIAVGISLVVHSRFQAWQNPEIFRSRAGRDAVALRRFLLWWLGSVLEALFVVAASLVLFGVHLHPSLQEQTIPLVLGGPVSTVRFFAFVALMTVVNLRTLYECPNASVTLAILCTLVPFYVTVFLPAFSYLPAMFMPALAAVLFGHMVLTFASRAIAALIFKQ